ncbi:MAG: phosphoenolpyruvate synthase [Candidatus Pacearchaeota archaeon]|nr:MAG: phosphoenolpyruvate synthase [Candidatus Pacearchaeota archaeon]
MKEEGVIFIKWFSELDKNSGGVAGGKGANLAEIYNLGINVPPGFVVTAQAYNYFIKNSGIDEKIRQLLSKIDYENTRELTEVTEKVRELITKADFPKNMEEEIIEAYETLSLEEGKFKGKTAEVIVGKAEPIFVAVRSSATTEDLAEASFAGQQETFLNVRGNEELLDKIKECFASLFTARATYYRHKKGFKHEQASLAVVIQKMINSEKSGVIFSKDPSTGEKNVIIEAVFGLGEGIVSGKITPDRYIVSGESFNNFEIKKEIISKKKIAIVRGENGKDLIVKLKEKDSEKRVLNDKEIKELAFIALKLEKHYQKPQDIEFAIESGEIYVVQTRPITTLEKKYEKTQTEIKGEAILTGIAASPGIGVGKVKIVRSLEDLKKINKGDVLVTTMTNPDMVVTMQKCSAIVTDEGGLTAHAAIVSREMGIPAVVGTEEATSKLKENEVVTVDGFTGKIYKGKIAEAKEKEIKEVKSKTKTKIKVIIDLPSFSKRAAKTGIKSVGLARLEGVIAESGKHPLYFLEKGKIKEYEELIYKGLKELCEPFDEIWIRTSDIRTDEFINLEGAPKEKEANPMLGMHGIRFSLRNPEILKAELLAMKKISDSGKKIGIMAPQIISVEEINQLKKFVKEINLNAKVGVMIETPASVQIIEELCKTGIDFASFGTNDLTQYTLAVDRGNKEVQDLYNEMHPAILKQLSYVIKVCRMYGVESSICGQAGSRKEMVKFLVENGINSISVNADVAAEIAEYIESLEKQINEKYEKENQKESDKEILKKETIINLNQNLSSERIKEEIKKELEEFPIVRGAEWPLEESYLDDFKSDIVSDIEKEKDNDVSYIF